MQPHFAPAQEEGCCSQGKRPFAPSPNHFRELSLFRAIAQVRSFPRQKVSLATSQCKIVRCSLEAPSVYGWECWDYSSEAWGPPQFQEKSSRSEKAILGALGGFRGILGAALGIQKLILGMRNSILGMASHDLSNTRTTILRATPGAILGFDGHPHERIFICACILGAFFQELGRSPCARTTLRAQRLKKFKIPPRIEIFKRDWKFQASHPPNPDFLWAIFQ